MTGNHVMRESADELRAELAGLDLRVCPDGMAELDGLVPEHGPLVRALMRAEAELLTADAMAMQVGTYEPRTADQRRADALLLIMQRVADLTRAA